MKKLLKITGTVCSAWLTAFISVFIMAPSQCYGQADRESWQPPEEIMDSIGVSPGMRIGEAGAGRGYFTFPLARRVGSGGVVFANDISTQGINFIRERAVREDIGNIKTVIGEVEDPLFPGKSLDMVVMVYVLHEVERPIPFVKNIGLYLKPGGQLVIIERNTNLDRTHIPQFMTKAQILETAGESGFKLERIYSFLPFDYIYILTQL